MTSIASLTGTAALIGDPARAAMLVTLMDGRALTAGELAGAAGVTPQTASGHLGRLHEAGLLALEQQGRHRYYRIASPSVGNIVESLMSVTGELAEAARRVRPVRTGPRDQALRHARLCYDHLAGEIAVGIADSMVKRGQLDFTADGGMLTATGERFLGSIGVELPAGGSRSGPTFCRPCLDWSQRRPHLAGKVGRSLCATLMKEGWFTRPSEGRAVAITRRGEAALKRHFGLDP